MAPKCDNFCFRVDLYGPKYVQAIHGRFLLAATAATMIGPTLLLNLRKMSENAAIQGMVVPRYVVDLTHFRPSLDPFGYVILLGDLLWDLLVVINEYMIRQTNARLNIMFS